MKKIFTILVAFMLCGLTMKVQAGKRLNRIKMKQIAIFYSIILMLLFGCASQNELLKKAIETNNMPNIETSLGKGANLDYGMEVAILSHNTELAKYFLNKGCSCDLGLKIAFENNDIEIMKIMLDNGAKTTYYLDNITDVSFVDLSTKKETPIDITMNKKTGTHDNLEYSYYVPAIKLPVTNGNYICRYKISKAISESTYLFLAIEKGNLEMVKLFLSQKVDYHRLFFLGEISLNINHPFASKSQILNSFKADGESNVVINNKVLISKSKDNFISSMQIPFPLEKSTPYDYAIRIFSKKEIIEILK